MGKNEEEAWHNKLDLVSKAPKNHNVVSFSGSFDLEKIIIYEI